MNDNIKFLVSVNDGGQLHTNLYSEDEYNNNVMPLLSKNYTPDQYSVTGLQDTISDNITEDNQYLISVSSNGHTYSKPYSGKELLGGKLTEISRQFPDYHIQYIDGAVRTDDTSGEIVSIPWDKQLSKKAGQLLKSTTKTMEQTNEVAEEAKSTSLSDLLAERGDALRNFANMAVYNGLTKTPEELEEMHAKELEEREARRREQEDVQRLEETRKQISEINKQLGEWSVREQAAGEEDFGGENIDWIVKNAERKAKLLKKRAELVKQQSENPMYRKEEKRIEGIAEDIRDKAYKVTSDISVEGDLVTYNNPEADTWQAARYFADNALKTINAPDDNENGFSAFLKGAGDTFSNVDFWTMGLESISSNTKVKRVFNKIADKVNNYSDKTLSETDFDNILTDAEKELIKSFVSASEAQALRAYDTNNMYNAGTIAADSVGFMAQFILTGGVGEAFAGATKTAAKGFAKWIAKNTGKVGKRAAIDAAVASQTLVGRGAAKLADAVATPVLKAVPMTLMQTGLYKNYAEKLTERDDAGNLTYDYDTAILPALRDAGLEVWSEMALEPVLAVFGKTISKGIANLPKTSKVGAFMKTKLDDITSFLHNREAIDILTKAGFDGYFEEIGEEILAAGVSSMWEPEAWNQFWEKDNLVSMAVAFAPMSVIGGGMSMANYIKRTMAYQEAAPKVRDMLLNRTNITEAQLNALFDRKSATMQDIADKISDIVKPIIESGAISADEFKALYDFAGATAQKDIAQALMDRMTTDARNNMRAELNEKTGGKTIYGKDKDGNETVSIYTDANGKKRYVIIDETSEDTLALSMDEQGGNIKIVDPSELEITTMPANQYLDAQVTAAKQVEEQNQIAQQQKQQKQSVMEALKARKPVKLYSPVSNLREDYIFLGWDGDMAVVANAQTGDEERRTVQEMANALNISPSILTKDQQTQMQVEKSRRYDSLARSANDYKGAPISYGDVSGSLLRVKSKGDEQGESYLEAQIVTESGEVVSVNVTPQQIEDFIAERKELVANAGAEANDRRAKDRERKARQAKDAEQYREAKAKFINPDGSIREGEWLENDPRSYAIYSDGKYGKKDTDATLRAALAKAQERAQKALAARDNESNPDFKQPLRDEYDHAVAALDTLDGLIAERGMDESASGALTPEQASEKFAEMEQMGLTSDEIIDLALQSIEETQARIDAIAKPQVSTDIPAYMEEKRKYAELVAAEQKKIDYWRSILNAPMTELERQNPDMANARMRRRMLDILTEKQSTKDAETLARLDAELQQVSEGFIGRAIADINKDNDNVVIVTEASVADRMRELGSKESTIEQVLKAIADGDQPKGFFDTDTGVIFMVAENNYDVRDSQITFVHERQHKRTRARGLASVLIDRLGLSGLSEEEKKSALLAEMHKLFRGNFYDGKSALTIADELISYGVERVFRGDIDGVGLNETITNFVKNIDNERGETSNLSGAGAAAYGGASYRVGADGNAAVEGVGTTEVGGQGTGTAIGGEEESEGKVAYANGSTIQGLESYSRDEIKQLIENHIANTLSGNGIDADIVAIELHGSRGRGTAREDSDLDAVVEYRGDIREDSMFNILNDEDSRLVIDGIGVDINPIRAEETGTMESYMKRSQEYDAQKIQQQAASENEALFRATLQQAYDSAATSINGNKLPAAFNKIKWQEGSVNLDLGGGKFDNATEFLKGKGVENLIFDPFNRDAEWNKRIAEQVQTGGVDSVTCNNVLNVIDNEASRENVILQASKAIKPDGVAYFYIYEGDKSAIGKDKGQGRWQNNMTTRQYIPEVSKYFGDVKRRGQLIEARNPLPTDEQSVWSFTGAYDGNNELRFSVANNNQQIFISNALASLDKIQMKSGNAQAWINKIQQAGGLKKEEDKWIGLTDWLKGQKGDITKEDVAEYIREHQVQIEEVNYGDVTDVNGFEGLDFYTTEYKELLDMYAEEDNPADYAKNEMEARHGSNFWFHFFVNGGGEIDVDQESFDTYDEMFTALQQYGVYPNQDVNSINPIRLDYTTEGLVNKREIALTVPTIAPWNKSDEIHFGDAGEGRAIAWIRFGSSKYYIPEYDNFYEFKKRMTEKYFPGTFGYNIPDLSKLTDEERAEYDRLESIKKSVPMNKSRGTVLVIDEIQSKRHQDGREKGYLDSTDAARKLEDFNKSLEEKYGPHYEERMNFNERLEQSELIAKKSGVPDAPFRDSWDALAMKRMLRLAAEEGYDKIAWTSGQMQSDRYGLTKNLGDFYYKPNEDGTYKVSAALNQRRPGYTDYSDLNFDSLTVNGIGEIFGKEIATKVSEGKGRKGYSHNNEGEWITFSGRDLKMANEGMRYFYDKRLVNWMNKYGKKWGVQVADLTLMNLENKEGWHSIDITPEMKESVMEGQPMFSVGGNSGYIGYSMSKRAVNAREEGAYPKTDFKQNYGISQGMLDALVSAGTVDNTEWHHTSKYGNKTTFYRWNDFAYKAFSENRESVESVYKDKSLSKEEKVSQIENILNTAIVPIREQYDALASEYEAVRQSIDILNKDREAERNAYLAEVRSNAEDFTASNGAIVRIGEDGPVAYDADGNRLSKRNGREMRDAALKEYEDNYDYYGSRFNFSKQQEFSDAVGRSIDLQSRMTSLINAERESAGGALFRATEIAGNPSLIAVHNLTENNLLDAFDLGGFPMPSIAITKADIGHTDFGNISLVFGKETINPKNQKNKVYSGDAWTPTFPAINYKLNEDKASDIANRAREVGDLPLFNPSHFDRVNYEGRIEDSSARSLIEAFKNDYNAKQFYLAEQGNPVREYEVHEVEKYTEEGVRRIKELLDKIGLENLKGVDWNLTPEILQVVKGFLNANRDIDDSRIKRIARNYVKNAIDYATHGNKESEVDYDATHRKIDERIDQSAFEKWLEDLFSGIVEKRGIRNEVDMFTPIGNRRKWEKLYDEVTLDNVVKAMSKKPKRGGSGFFGGNIFGASSKAYNSMADIREDAARRMAVVDSEELKKQKDDILNRLSNVKITEKELGIGEMFDLTENIRDAVAKSHTADGIHRYLKDYYPDITMGAAQEIADIVKDIQSLSTKYFEAKPYRAVGFDEVKLAIVPEGTSQAVVDGLLERGVPVRTYEKNNQQERMDIISNATEEMGLRFRTIEITPEVRDEMYQIEALARLRGKYLKAPKGEDTNLNPEQWALVRTKNYTAWFGDWENDPENASKVLDENGEPMVMYHGGKGEITTFNPARIGSNIDNGTMGAGFYFTSDKQNADNYARNAEGEGPVNTTSVYLNIRNPKRVRWNELSGDNKKESEAFTSKAKAQGYDGFIAEAVNGATWYVAFEPNQIKSATENNGEFSRENDDIRFSVVSKLNAQFNDNLARQAAGADLGENFEYDLGMPSKYLLSAGFPDLPIRLRPSVLNRKANDPGHPYDITELKDLVKTIQKPWAIFKYGKDGDARNIIIGIEHNGKQFLVGIFLNPVINGRSLEINSVRNIFPKDNDEWIRWIELGKHIRIDNKTKVIDSINALRNTIKENQPLDSKLGIDPLAFTEERLISIAKEVKKFKNPNFEEIDFRVTPAQDAEYRKAYEAGDEQKAMEMLRDAFLEAFPDTLVLDSDGKPKVVLHGTPNSFTIFDKNKVGTNTDAGWLGTGFYFYGNNPEYASQYAKGGSVMPLFLNISEPYFATSTEMDRLAENNSKKASDEFRQMLEDDGYDGVFYNEDLNEEWVAFNPSQIKSAEPFTFDDNGNLIPLSQRFNPNKDDIRFSVSPATQLRKKGLADSLTEEQMSSITNDAFASMDEQTRRKIAEEQIRLGGDLVQPVMDYISRIAETPDSAGISQMDADIIEGVRQNLVKMVGAEDGDITTNDTLWLVYDYVHSDDTYIYDAIKNRRIRRALGQARSVAPEMSLDDYLKAAAEAKDDIIAEYRALRKLADSLTSVMDAMEARRDFDRATVGRVVKLANSVISSNLLDDMTKGEVKRITGVIRRATGMRNIQTRIYELYNIILNNNLRRLKNLFEKELKRKASKVGSKNVVEQGRLDLNGQKIMAALKDNLDKIAYDDNGQVIVSQALFDRINDAMDRAYSEDKAVSSDAELELIGLSYARQYIEGVAASEKEEQDIKDSLKQADQSLADGKLDKKSHGEFVKEQARALAECRTERVKAFTELVQKVQDMSAASHDLAIKFVERNKERIAQIHHEANSDLEGVPANEHPSEPTKKDRLINSSATKFFLRSLGTFDMLLRMLGRMSPNGEGYLWNRFMRGWIDATSNEYTGVKNAKMMLDAKVSEIFGRKMVWSDLYAMVNRMPKATVKFWDGGEMREHEVTQGNLLYIMLADQMTDGRMKLRAMGITEDDVDAIRAQMDSRFISLADWIVHDFLPSRRDAYNAVHERMFGAPMSKVQNYFPLRILSNARTKQVDVATGNVEQSTPSTVTGNIMKRTRNALALDIMGTDAFVLVMDHVQKMEHWAAFAEWNRDLSDLLSYKRFRNKVQNMTSIYGAKNDLYNEFVDVAMIAAGSYRTKSTKVDVAAGKLAKGVTSAKISFRPYTALKQIQSGLAYFSEAKPMYIAEGFSKGWKWSKENLPMFEKRIKARDMGDQNLSQSTLPEFLENASNKGMGLNVLIDAFTVSVGAYAIYQTKYNQYLKMGFSPQASDKRAKQDAVILYNETQQSSESAFLSTVQADKTWLSKLISVFRNSSFGYTRQVVDALRNITKRQSSDYKRTSIEYLTKQLIREGLSDIDALKAAKDIYNRQRIKDPLRVVLFGFILTMTWNLLSSLPYLFFGDDDDEKEAMWEEALLRMIFGPIEGLAFGNTLAEIGYRAITGWDFTNVSQAQMPIMSDIAKIANEMKSDWVRALNDLVNLGIQMGIGVNPQTFEDMIMAVIDRCNGDIETSKEALILGLRVINAPQSSIDKLYLDEIDMSAKEASELSIPELASRYAKYKKMRNAGPFTPLYSFNPELDEKTTQKYIRQFESKAKERMKIGEENDYAEISEEAKALNDRISSLRKKAKEGDPEADRQLMEIFMSPDYAPLMRFYKLNEEMNSYINKAIRAKSNEEMADYLEEANRLRGEMIEDYRNDPSEKAYFRDIYARYSYGILPEMSRLDKKYKEEYAKSNPDYLAWEEQHKEERANAAAKAEANARKIIEIDAQLKKYESTLPNGRKHYVNMHERERLYAEKKRIREEGVTEKQILNRIDKTKPKYTEEDYMPEDIYNSPEYQIYLEMRELGSLRGYTFKFKSIEEIRQKAKDEEDPEKRAALMLEMNDKKLAIAEEIHEKLKQKATGSN